MPRPVRLDLPSVIVLLLILFALITGPDWAADGCPPPGSASVHLDAVHLDADVSGGVPCGSEAPCPAGEGCAACATCCKVAVRSLAPQVARTTDPPCFSLAVLPLAAAGPRGSVWHPPRD